MQKERITADELFVLDRRSRAVVRSPTKPLKQSACTPLFFHCYDLRDAGACIHSHSQATVMATLLWPGAEFRISHQEMIKVRANMSSFEISARPMLAGPIRAASL